MTVSAILGEKGRRVVTLTPEVSVRDACTVLASEKIGALVVLRHDGSIAGILSERDIVRAFAAHGAIALDHPLSSHMSAHVVTCAEEDTIFAVMERMTQGRFRHMPVVKNGRLTGLISIGDVVKRRIEMADREANEIRAYIASA